MTKSVFVTLAGHTNAGKSSLLNAIIGEKIASVSPKPQTTRTRITGIKTVDETQMEHGVYCQEADLPLQGVAVHICLLDSHFQ